MTFRNCVQATAWSIVLGCYVVLVTTSAHAQNLWTGANSNLWNDPLNWSFGIAPAMNSVRIVIGID